MKTMMKKQWMMLLFTAFTGFATALEIPENGSLLLSLDATEPSPDMTLAGDTVLAWGPFALMNTNNLPPTLTSNYGGVQAVRFNYLSDSILRSTEVTPASVTGGNAWSIEVWYYAPEMQTYNSILGWGNDQSDNGKGQAAAIVFGNDVESGAARHGTDVDNYNLGYASEVPSVNNWHLLTLTYSGSAAGEQVERIYVDGELVNGRENLVLDIISETHFHLGGFFRPNGGYFIQRCNGALARARLYSGTLTYPQVIGNFNSEAAEFGLSTLPDTINIFEGSGPWSTAALWSKGTVASAGEQAFISGTAAVSDAQTAENLTIAGTLNIEGSSAELATTGTTFVGYGSGALGLSDGATFTTGVNNNQSLVVGFRQKGVIAVTNATLDATAGSFSLGYDALGYGYADFHNATNSFKDVYVGNTSGGSGHIFQTNGNFETFGEFKIACGQESEGNVDFQSTDVSIGGRFIVGENIDATGSYTQNGGTLELLGSEATIGKEGSNSQGSLFLKDTEMTCTPQLWVGAQSGSLIATNSHITCQTHMQIGLASTDAQGKVELIDSTLNVVTVFLGLYATTLGQLYIDDSNVNSTYLRIGRVANGTGCVTLNTGAITNAAEISVGYDGIGVVSNITGIIKTKDLFVAHNSDTSSGYLYLGNSSITEISSTAALQIGRAGSGTLDCHGYLDMKNSTGSIIVGNLAGSTGTFNMYPDAEVLVQNRLEVGLIQGVGTFNQYGGNLSVIDLIRLGGMNSNYSDALGIFNLYGGTVTNNNPVYVGLYGRGELTIAGGEAIFPHSDHGLTIGTFIAGDGGASTGSVYLTGGRLGVGNIRNVNGYSEFFFDGGTLTALADNTTFCQGLDKAEIRAGGAKIDSNGHNITIAQSLAHDSRNGAPPKDGGLTKLGAGTLTMNGTLDFTGDLGANGGTLDISATSYALSSGSAIWGNGTLVPPSGGLSIPSGSWAVPGDTNGIGTLTVNGNLAVNGEIRTRISPDGTDCGTLSVAETLLFAPGSELTISNPENMTEGESYTLVTASTLNGQPEITNLPRLWTLKVSSDQIRATYISGTIIIVN